MDPHTSSDPYFVRLREMHAAVEARLREGARLRAQLYGESVVVVSSESAKPSHKSTTDVG
jgi:hypothetical protein